MGIAKARGTAAERAVVEYLRSRGWPYAERRALNGARDRGDVAGVPSTVIEVKNEARVTLADYADETRVEQRNDGARYGAAWFKRRGTTNPGRWYVLLDGENFTTLLADALGIENVEEPS